MKPFDEAFPITPEHREDQWRKGICAVFAGFVATENRKARRATESYATVPAFWENEDQKKLVMPSLKGLLDAEREREKIRKEENSKRPFGEKTMLQPPKYSKPKKDRGKNRGRRDYDFPGINSYLSRVTSSRRERKETFEMINNFIEILHSEDNDLTQWKIRYGNTIITEQLNFLWELTDIGEDLFPVKSEVNKDFDISKEKVREDAKDDGENIEDDENNNSKNKVKGRKRSPGLGDWWNI